jgi:hypothetical protein
MTCVKCLELFAEAIPGVIIQLLAIITSDPKNDIGNSAWISLTISALSTGFISATISYDYDTDPKKRQQTPDFYGYIPTTAIKRLTVFASMLLFSASMLIVRCMTIVLLGTIGTKWAFAYIGTDLSLYLLVKLLRKDFWYWMPLEGFAAAVNSLLLRVTVKVITDFTSIVQFRHPNEVGGLFWMIGFLLTMGSLPIAMFVAEPYVTERSMSIAWFVAVSFIPLAAVSFFVFTFIIERQYLSTFFSTQRGKDYTIMNFRNGDDSVKAKYIFKMTKHHWISIEEEVKAWVEANWEQWENEKPEWFTDTIKAKVPVEYIPITGDARRRESLRRTSVDVEAEGGLGGALKASIRRASVGVGEDVVRVVPINEDI